MAVERTHGQVLIACDYGVLHVEECYQTSQPTEPQQLRQHIRRKSLAP